MTGREELQRLASIVESNRKKLEDLELRKQKIMEIIDEHDTTLSVLKQLIESPSGNAKINIGCGVSLPFTASNDVKAFVDLGSGIFGERSMESSLKITQQRKESVLQVDKMLDEQIDQVSEIIQTAAMEFNKAAESLKANVSPVQNQSMSEKEVVVEEEKPSETKRITRRRRGTELTLDD